MKKALELFCKSYNYTENIKIHSQAQYICQEVFYLAKHKYLFGNEIGWH